MKNSVQEQVLGIPITSGSYQVVMSPRGRGYLTGSDGQYSLSFPLNGSSACKKRKVNSVLRNMNKLGKKADTFAAGIREHVRLGQKITETVKGKLSLGAKILQLGGMGRIFRRLFNVGEGEKLLKASQCYLSTTAGPIAGLLFISTEKIAFCSERSMEFSSPNGESVRVHYKVLIPILKIKGINQSENMKNPSQKYIDIVTVDNFDFWFMGFLNYKKTFKYLQLAVFRTLDDVRVTC
ncbi:GRAM domain-containing protein / ABA-responsive protein-related [Tripterygium wilfordii]|uniref:GRAM domain-containing protein / ABA-responsive protein-related n=1 Tax=Tripterygium wilfordii TaxID=458696 RepID=A0A7J7DU79_TRIWF|nr:putative GEM-like protein 8 [Tripterygium wilfordii]XP_038686576.1 putative GEM-like protein 8 [Tripterygium wilfordii]KAF5749851.1 GRAM domain-containing protein / ABA-responsive protein-related [Tripterygium wilfordii]